MRVSSFFEKFSPNFSAAKSPKFITVALSSFDKVSLGSAICGVVCFDCSADSADADVFSLVFSSATAVSCDKSIKADSTPAIILINLFLIFCSSFRLLRHLLRKKRLECRYFLINSCFNIAVRLKNELIAVKNNAAVIRRFL